MPEEHRRPPAVVDRSEMRRALEGALRIEPARTAVITIDCHRGHLDPSIATMPVRAELAAQVVSTVARLLRRAREARLPVIHVILQNRLLPSGTVESMVNPFWRALEDAKQSLTPTLPSTVRGHNLAGSPQTELMPELGPEPGDLVIDTKRRLSIFRETDLDLLLKDLGIDTVVLCGINTNTCVLCAAFEAFNRDLRVVVVSDGVASMYGDDLHFFGLENVARCLGWVVTCDELLARLPEKVGLPA
ncbi:MAG TPA: cysteine hydrolase [Acidimicrobiales bacterium]|nr:cysteine hydrolase [Acidimicrobiales bacterium]